MAEHLVTIEDYIYKPTHKNSRTDTGVGILKVEPPINPGKNFSRVILGEQANGVTLDHLVTTTDHTIFIATATQNHERRYPADATAAIEEIRSRLKRLADFPEDTLLIMADEPFPDAPSPQHPHSHP